MKAWWLPDVITRPVDNLLRAWAAVDHDDDPAFDEHGLPMTAFGEPLTDPEGNILV